MTPPAFTPWLLRHFRRITSSGSFFPEIDGLRFVAIAAVVGCHLYFHVIDNLRSLGWPAETVDFYAELLGRFFFSGRQGVELFFVISGFIISLPFVGAQLGRGAPPSYGRYLLRRVTRLEPPYVVSTLALFLVDRCWLHRIDPAQIVKSLGASLTYTHTLFFPGRLPMINGALWSLEIEIQFYLLAPLICWLYFRTGRAARRRVAGVVVLVAWALMADRWRSLSLAGFGQFFIAGLVVCDLVLSGDAAGGRSRGRAAAGGVVMLLLLTVDFLDTSQPLIAILAPLLFGLVCLLALVNPHLKAALSRPVVVVIGGMCYSIYLLHGAVVTFADHFIRKIGVTAGVVGYVTIQVTLLLTAIVLISAAFFKLVERPCMRRHWPRELAEWIGGWGGTKPRLQS